MVVLRSDHSTLDGLYIIQTLYMGMQFSPDTCVLILYYKTDNHWLTQAPDW